MMTSVSMLLRMIGAATAISLLKRFGMLASHRPDIGDDAGNRGRRGTCRARQMGACPRPLASDKVTVRRRHGTQSGRHRLAIGGKTHRTTGFTPFEAGVSEELVESLGDCLALDCLRARHHPGTYTGRDPAAARDFSCGAQIAQA